MALIIVAVFFGVAVCVNVTMAMLAPSSWTELVVGNTYAAREEFNGKLAVAEIVGTTEEGRERHDA